MSLKKKGLDKPEDNWLVSYADMMTLLLFLFIILYQMAVLKEGNIQKLAIASSAPTVPASSSTDSEGPGQQNANYYYISKSSSGVSSVSTQSPSSQHSTGSSKNSNTASGKKPNTGKTKATITNPSYTQVKAFAANNLGNSNISVQQTQTGVIFDIQAEVLFNSGTSQIKAGSYTVLDKISNYLGSLSNDIIVAGYTDNQPIHTADYQSNWELSCDRAAKVLRYFTETEGLSSSRFQAVGYGENRPLADNSTADGRYQNRRVEIIVVKAA